MTEPLSLSSLIEQARAAERSGDLDEALELYEAAFSRATAEGAAEAIAQILRWIGTVRRERGELDLALELSQASVAIASAHGLKEQVAAGLNCIAIIEQLRGDIDAASEIYRSALRLADEASDARLSAMVAQNLATLAIVHGELEEALELHARAREACRALGDDLTSARVLNNMGVAHIDLRHWDAAATCLDEAHALAERAGDLPTLGRVEINRTELCIGRGALTAAAEHCGHALEIFTRLGSSAGVAETDKFYGIIHRDTDRPELAEGHFGRAVEAARRIPEPLIEAEALREWALLHWEAGRPQSAFQALNTSYRVYLELGARRELIDLDRRLSEIERIYLQVVQTWGESIEAKDRYTAGHCQRVADYACALASRVGVAGRDLVWFRMGAFLHDVGKLEVPEEILNKPGKLTAEEWRLMQSHAAAGDRIVAELGFPWDIRPMVRSHHERWDGGGYPDGLAGEEIPLHARILSIADIYDALTSTRSYRPALSREEALEIMEADAGRLVDPTLFALFGEVLQEPDPRGPQVAIPA